MCEWRAAGGRTGVGSWLLPKYASLFPCLSCQPIRSSAAVLGTNTALGVSRFDQLVAATEEVIHQNERVRANFALFEATLQQDLANLIPHKWLPIRGVCQSVRPAVIRGLWHSDPDPSGP